MSITHTDRERLRCEQSFSLEIWASLARKADFISVQDSRRHSVVMFHVSPPVLNPSTLPALPLRENFLIMRGPSIRLLHLNLIVLPPESPTFPLHAHRLLNKILRPIFLVDPPAVPLRRALDHRPRLRECRQFPLSVVLFVVTVGIEHGAHLQELEVAFQRLGGDGFGHGEPGRTGGELFILESLVSYQADRCVRTNSADFVK